MGAMTVSTDPARGTVLDRLHRLGIGDIPVLGELFKSRSRSRAKTNLMVFIRPTIVRTAAEARQLTSQRYGYIRNEQLRARPLEEPPLDTLVRDYLGAVPPVPAVRQPGDTVYAPVPAVPAPQITTRTGYPCARRPPSTTIVWPVRKLAASVSRNTIGHDASATAPNLPNGAFWTSFSFRAGLAVISPSTISVRMVPPRLGTPISIGSGMGALSRMVPFLRL